MKKQLVTLMMIVASVVGSQAQAQTGVADNLVSPNVGQTGVADNLTSLLTVLNAFAIGADQSVSEVAIPAEFIGDCSAEELFSGVCTQVLPQGMALHFQMKSIYGSLVQISAENCDGISVIDPKGHEIQISGAAVFDQRGMYDVLNRGFKTCEVRVKVMNR
ncbi:hypothetical protein EZJ49_14015 [Bdellovibrio bacteriovorus]|uniref:hypothetical protein n=1 Tax=Bdellovibrio bacteriovorus TaxID=959 RepID=UPI0021CFA132|nr:hypothetical protein [Bdellovibrio bacteriovorus]UXR64178.1 hypothetical protein EZJ49_14015 [Bdellovibrio bacteriovorus]